jgi:hypothetical protein
MSQYYTPFRIDGATTATNATKFQNVVITASNAISTSTAITARRICITTGVVPAFVAFGSTPVSGVNVGFQIPANDAMIFNFKSGDKVAVSAGSACAVSILDLD